MKTRYIAVALLTWLSTGLYLIPHYVAAANDPSPSILGKWTLRLYVQNSSVGVPLRDAELMISDKKIDVELTQVDVDGKVTGKIHREFQYAWPVNSDPSVIDVSSNEQGTAIAWHGRVRVRPDELVLHLVAAKTANESVRPKELFDFSSGGDGLLLLAATRKPPGDSSDKDFMSVRGLWELKRVLREGASSPEPPGQQRFPGYWTVMHDLVLLDGVHPLTGSRQVDFFHCEFDPDSKPHRVCIWHPENGRIQKGEWLSIYHVEGNTLTICSNGMNRDQQGWPTAFESKGNSPNTTLYTFERLSSPDPR
jgi:uncharacterized protein (TIGR03067 family)